MMRRNTNQALAEYFEVQAESYTSSSDPLVKEEGRQLRTIASKIRRGSRLSDYEYGLAMHNLEEQISPVIG